MSDVMTTLSLLTEGLEKKKKSLGEILEYTKSQEKLLKEEVFDLKTFNNIMKNKQFRIDNVKQIDDGFRPSYERVRGHIEKTPELYRDQINQMKNSIKLIGDLNVEIQVLEEKNFNRYKVIAGTLKEDVKTFRTNKKTVNNYYQNYNKQHESVRENFFDSKKWWLYMMR